MALKTRLSRRDNGKKLRGIRYGKRRASLTTQRRFEPLEDRHLLASNVLVNDPTLDPVAGGNFTQSETSLVVFGNTVVVGYNDSGSMVGGAQKFTGYSISTDMGNTFTDKGALPGNPGDDLGDPVLARDNVTGTIYFSTLSFTGNIQVFRSFDGGNTFAAPVNATPGKAGFQDKEWMAVDNFAGAGQGNIYLVERDFGPGNGIYFFSSTDGGATYGPNGGTLIASGGVIPQNVQGSFVAVDTNHDVYVFYFDERSFPETIKMRKSTDFGSTFGPEVTVTTLSTGPGFNGDLGLPWRSNAFPQVAVNETNGDLYLVYNDNPAGVDRADVFLTKSTDGGASWSAPQRVNDDATTRDQWQPSITLSPDATNIGIFYYDFDAGANLIDYVGRIGTVSGSTVMFDPSSLVSNASFAPNFGNDAAVNPVYMGDYDEAKADNEFLYTVWADNRLGTPDVRFSKIRHSFLVDLDIKPGSDPNSINTKSMGPIPVAILGSATFDVTTVDTSTVTFGPMGALPVHDPPGHLEDVNGDLITDLVFHFRQKETGIAPGDTEACIQGKTLSGIDIDGCDSVRVVPAVNLVVESMSDPSLNGMMLNQTLVDSAVTEAIAYWARQGVDATSLSALSRLDVRIADLDGDTLGITWLMDEAVWIDRDAGGFGWSQGQTSEGVDLLSAVVHELGHILGFDHDVLGSTLGVGQRYLPNVVPTVGDVNHDQVFDRLDLVQVLQSGRYRSGQPAVWGQGDWNGDGVFDQLDIVAALQNGSYMRFTAEVDAAFTHV